MSYVCIIKIIHTRDLGNALEYRDDIQLGDRQMSVEFPLHMKLKTS